MAPECPEDLKPVRGVLFGLAFTAIGVAVIALARVAFLHFAR